MTTISNKDRQYNDENKPDENTNNDLKNNTQKTGDWATRIPPTTDGVNTGAREA